MLVRKLASRCCPDLAIAALTVLAALVSFAPACADDDQYKGWFAALDAAMTQPNSLDQHYANVSTSASGILERLVVDNKQKTTVRGSIGYDFGRDLGSLQASYWSFDHDDSNESTQSGYVYPTLVGGNYNSVVYYGIAPPSSLTGRSKVKARTLDIDYVRPMPVGEKLTIKWLTGLRSATFDEDLGFEDVGAFSTYLQNRHIDSKAIGIRLGATAVFGFTKHFSLEGSMAVSMLQAKTNADGDQSPVPSPLAGSSVSSSDDHVRGEIRDYDLRAVWSYGRLDYYAGYSGSTWEGLVANPLPAPGCCNSGPAVERSRDSVSFNSLHAGIVWRFSPQKRPFRP